MVGSATLPVTPVTCDLISKPAGHYSPAVTSGGFIFVSGQLPTTVDGSGDPSSIFEHQMGRALDNVCRILAHAGCGVERIAKVTIYLVGIENWPTANSVFCEYLGAHRPARAIIPVPALHHGYLVEIDAIALAP